MSKFVIPTVDEIFAYVSEKSGWPPTFCRFYSEKFWNHYEAQGWVLSNGNKMKSWQAAYNSQWQVLKYDPDIKMLTAAKAMVMSAPSNNELNNRYRIYVEKGSEALLREEWIECYNALKKEGLAKLPNETIVRIVESCGNNREIGKAMSAYEIFKMYKDAGHQQIIQRVAV